MKILVADDDPTLRMLMREILEVTLGCEVIEATNGEEAWNMLDAGGTADLCIFDMRMPRMGGIELVARLRADERFCQYKIMVCSGVNERAPVLEAVSVGIDAYLLKPFVGDTLQTQVLKLWEKPLSSPPPKALIPVDEVLKRLGTKPQTYLKLLKTFTDDVSDAIVTLRGNWTTEVRQESIVRLSAIRGSGSTLGADSLVARVASLETSIEKNDVSAKNSKLSALEIENKRVIAATVKLDKEIQVQEIIQAAPAEVVIASEPMREIPEAIGATLDFLKH
jgi:two-component system chemotaxis response regulator CheY